MPFALDSLQGARKAYQEFLSRNKSSGHARYIFPFFAGSYFAYRKIDVLRTISISRALSSNPSYVDFGCGYGDYLEKVREYIPTAIGVEAEAGIFYAMQVPKPDFIEVMPVELFDRKADVGFVGWMEPGQDFRAHVAKKVDCVITTFDSGGQCGINGACEFDEFGFMPVASWRTPSWIDVNAELMNRHYTPNLTAQEVTRLASLRSAHNIWQVYSKPQNHEQIRIALEKRLEKEAEEIHNGTSHYDFEQILDECGFGYMEELSGMQSGKKLWQVRFDS